MLVLCSIIPLWKKVKFTAHPSLKWITFVQCKHDPKVKAVRANGKITEVKQPQDQSNSKMGDHLGSIHFVFFSGRNIRQICQILLISLNYAKTQLNFEKSLMSALGPNPIMKLESESLMKNNILLCSHFKLMIRQIVSQNILQRRR